MIISLIPIDNDTTQVISKKVPLLFSSAMDNTIRVWNLEDLTVQDVIECPKELEIM